jgi:hypothetical protein
LYIVMPLKCKMQNEFKIESKVEKLMLVCWNIWKYIL